MGRFIISEEVKKAQRLSVKRIQYHKELIKQTILRNPNKRMTMRSLAKLVDSRPEMQNRIEYYIKVMRDRGDIIPLTDSANTTLWRLPEPIKAAMDHASEIDGVNTSEAVSVETNVDAPVETTHVEAEAKDEPAPVTEEPVPSPMEVTTEKEEPRVEISVSQEPKDAKHMEFKRRPRAIPITDNNQRQPSKTITLNFYF